MLAPWGMTSPQSTTISQDGLTSVDVWRAGKGRGSEGTGNSPRETSLAGYCLTMLFQEGGLHGCGCSMETRQLGGLETDCKAKLKTRDELVTESGRGVLA